MKVKIFQQNIQWESPQINWEDLIAKVKQFHDVDLLVFPEMVLTGFSMEPEKYAWSTDDKRLKAIQELAVNLDVAIVFSCMIEEEGKYYNRLFWFLPSGERRQYDKKHLFSFAKEEQYYTAGTNHLVIKYKGWRFASFICYDLRFPVWCRNHKEGELNYDAAIVVANWPKSRSVAWSSLLKARSIENQAYYIASNRVGVDGSGLEYSGDSIVMDPLGEELAIGEEGAEDILSVDLSKEHLLKVRKTFPFLNDADNFDLK